MPTKKIEKKYADNIFHMEILKIKEERVHPRRNRQEKGASEHREAGGGGGGGARP